VLERVVFGMLSAALFVLLGDFGYWALLIVGVLLVPTLWLLMIMDMTGWSSMEVCDQRLIIGRDVEFDLRGVSFSVDDEKLVITRTLDEKSAQVWSLWGRRGRDLLLIIKAGIEAAKTTGPSGSPWRVAPRHSEMQE
jgi:hypothetical protein